MHHIKAGIIFFIVYIKAEKKNVLLYIKVSMKRNATLKKRIDSKQNLVRQELFLYVQDRKSVV